MRRWSILVLLMGWLLTAGALAQGAAPTVEARLNFNALHPGQQATVAVVVDIPEGLHSQSNTPTSDDYVRFAIEPSKSDWAAALPVRYPKGEEVNYPALGPLNVYTGRVIAYIPIVVESKAAPGEVRFDGKLQIQLCDDQTCFRPFSNQRAIPFSVTTNVVAIDQPVNGTNADLFAGFDPRAFAEQPPADAAEIQLFGWTFRLEHSAYGVAFAIAFVVGVIFNLMPCVLPVVPLKAIGFYEASQHDRARCFMLGVVFSLGLLTVFAILAVLVFVGQMLWGRLFAEAWFVWSIVGILVLMAAGQLGAFSVVLPNSVYSYVPTHSSWTGNFLFGGFTAILSTPCTAPMFLGLLVWASGQPTWLGIAAFMTVGLGMATPYLVLAGFPGLARKLPRTGAWSELLKQFMAFLLLAVAAWFAAGRLISGNAYLWVVFAIVLAGCVFLVVRTRMISPTRRAVAIATLIAVAITGSVLWFTLRLASGGHDLIDWQPYSQSAFAAAIDSDKLVMLEFTANWCANCKELESRVFRDQRTADALKEHGVTPIRVDLTHEDAPGWRKLRELSSSGGIPLTVIYSPKLDRPIQLSSIYTTDNLIAAIDRAR